MHGCESALGIVELDPSPTGRDVSEFGLGEFGLVLALDSVVLDTAERSRLRAAGGTAKALGFGICGSNCDG